MKNMLPKKHISLEKSYLGFGAVIIKILQHPCSVEELWNKCNKDSVVKHSFEDLLLTLDYLYALDIILVDEKGVICLN